MEVWRRQASRLAAMVGAPLVLAACQTTSWDADTPVQCRVARAEVEVSCAILPDGGMTDCRVVKETAPGCGFAEAALESAGRSRLSVRAPERASPDSRVTYRLRFRNS